MPALEQNRSIGPKRRSVSSIRCLMSCSRPTSQRNAAPSIAAATASAFARSRSATTTFAAPARWNAWHSALPMPLAPPVTTTTLPATCIVALPFETSGQDSIEHGGVMTGGTEQHKTMPDRVLEAQPLPGVEDDTEAVQHAACNDEP